MGDLLISIHTHAHTCSHFFFPFLFFGNLLYFCKIATSDLGVASVKYVNVVFFCKHSKIERD